MLLWLHLLNCLVAASIPEVNDLEEFLREKLAAQNGASERKIVSAIDGLRGVLCTLPLDELVRAHDKVELELVVQMHQIPATVTTNPVPNPSPTTLIDGDFELTDAEMDDFMSKFVEAMNFLLSSLFILALVVFLQRNF